MNEKSSAAILMKIFLGLLSNIYHYREKILSGGDDEDLHQLRIACRQTVVLMGEFGLLYDGKEFLEHRAGVKDIITMSNKKRDMDVLNIELYKIEETIEASQHQKAFEILKEHVQKRIKKENDLIMTYLQSETCTDTLIAWKNYITDMKRRGVLIDGSLPIGSLSKYVVLQRFLKIKKHIKKLDYKNDMNTSLHKLRIEYKKMRYLLESFGYLYDKKAIRKLLKKIKKLQNILGRFHDNDQQKIIFEGLLKTEKHENVRSFIQEILLSHLKIYRKKEILEIRKKLMKFLKTEESYKELFS